MDDRDNIEQIIDELLALPEDEREGRLGELKEKDPGLHDDVVQWLQSIESSEGFLDEDIKTYSGVLFNSFCAELSDNTTDTTDSGKSAGAYRLVKRIGDGGMGAVYMAERADGVFDRKVAVKVLRFGISNRQTTFRFQQEQRILAGMQHPNIARLYDGGVMDDGTPYIVMELIGGLPITTFANEKKLGLRQRIELFLQACGAVQYAHQNMVIHRDLKPSNMLVEENGILRLLDFGIAKLIDNHEDINDPEIHTGAAHRFLSTAYAAPEQFLGLPVFTSADVYSLGVILYELTCGAPPYNLADKSQTEREKIICSTPVKSPSARIMEIRKENPGHCKTDPALVRGDLETIILKALEKDPSGRYASVQALSEDLQNWMHKRPISARPAGKVYRLSKFIKRNRKSVLSAAMIFLAMVFGVAYHINSLQKERDIAKSEAMKFEQIAGFMTGLFDFDQNYQVNPQEVTIAGLLAKGTDQIREDLHEQPEVKAAIKTAIAKSYLSLGLNQEAHSLLMETVELMQGLEENQKGEFGNVLYHLATAQSALRHPDRFETVDGLLAFLEQRKDTNGRLYANALWLKAVIMVRSDGASEVSDRLFDGYLEIMTSIYPKDNVSYITAMFEYAIYRSNPDEKERLLLEVLEHATSVLGRYHHDVANVKNSLAFHYETRDFEKTIHYLERALEIYLNIYGENHPRTVTTIANLGGMYRDAGKLEKALPYFEKALNGSYYLYQEDSAHIGRRLYGVGSVLAGLERFEEAEGYLESALEVLNQHYQTGFMFVEYPRTLLGVSIRGQGRIHEGEKLIKEAIENLTDFYGEGHGAVDFALGWLTQD